MTFLNHSFGSQDVPAYDSLAKWSMTPGSVISSYPEEKNLSLYVNGEIYNSNFSRLTLFG